MQNGYAVAESSRLQPWATTKESSDQALIESIAAGNKLAMQALFARHNVRVYRFVLRLVGDAAMAEDILSEVFIDVWRQADRFEARSQVSTWILAMARFKALSALRRRPAEGLDLDAADDIADANDDPEMTLEKQDRNTIMRNCLGQLSPEHREVIDLVYYHEKSVEEVAEIVGAPRSTVKTRMFYARKRLSELLVQAGV